MAIDPQDALEAVAKALKTGKEIQDERKRLVRYSALELRDLINLGCELSDPSTAPVGRTLRPKRVKL